MARTHKDLEVWNKSLDLVDKIYDIVNFIPKNEQFGITSQMTRAAISIPANIAEGCGRHSDKELLHFLAISRGSLAELETFLLICKRRNWLPEEKYNETNQLIEVIGKMLSKFVGSLRNIANKPIPITSNQ